MVLQSKFSKQKKNLIIVKLFKYNMNVQSVNEAFKYYVIKLEGWILKSLQKITAWREEWDHQKFKFQLVK